MKHECLLDKWRLLIVADAAYTKTIPKHFMNRFIIPLAMSATLVSGLSGCCGGDCMRASGEIAGNFLYAISRLAGIRKSDGVLKQIRGATQSKVGETYAGMKDSKSAAILESLPDAEAAGILYALDTKVMSKILSKMTPQKAATLTQLLQKGPPFEEEKESPQPNNAIQNKENNEGSAI